MGKDFLIVSFIEDDFLEPVQLEGFLVDLGIVRGEEFYDLWENGLGFVGFFYFMDRFHVVVVKL